MRVPSILTWMDLGCHVSPCRSRDCCGGLCGPNRVLCLVDYDAVLTEAGDYTEKYFKLRKLFASASGT